MAIDLAIDTLERAVHPASYTTQTFRLRDHDTVYFNRLARP